MVRVLAEGSLCTVGAWAPLGGTRRPTGVWLSGFTQFNQQFR
jgi:hypothetical protein